MRLARFGFDSLWSRLLGSLALVVVPAAILVVLLAVSLFNAALTSLRASQSAAASGRAGALHAWLDAAGRSLANASYAAGYVGAGDCGRLAEAFLRRNPGFSAVRFFDHAANPCAAGQSIGAKPPPAPPGAEAGAAYQLRVSGAQIWIVAQSPENLVSVLVVDNSALQKRLRTVADVDATHIAIVAANGEILAADPASADASWMPASHSAPARVWRAPDRTGATAAFATAPVDGAALSVLLRFDDLSLEAARRRLVILCGAQLAALALLAFVYAAAIRREIVQWIQEIDAAAQARGRDPESSAAAPVTTTMPRELRSVAKSFNAMADRAASRERALGTSLAENRALMLEMHHRIKNSLQVIQSYLALIRRSAERPEAQQLARIEARVGVLAIAYRLALTPGGMRPIAVRPFLEEICAAAVAGLRRPRQRVAYAIAWDGELVVDRAIPLGLGLVEALVAALDAPEAGYVGVRLADDENGEVVLKVESDAAPAEAALPDKVLRGLSNQLGASATTVGAGEILAWRFHP